MKSEEIRKLLDKTTENTPAAQKAAKEVIALGGTALPRVIAKLNDWAARQYPVNLSKILFLTKGREKVPLLIDSIENGKVMFLMTAFKILGDSREPDAYDALTKYLKNSDNLDSLRSLAADALGEFQSDEAIPLLKETAENAESEDLQLSAIVALAKLGNFEKGEIALKLALSKKDATIRPKATDALKYLVVPGLFDTAKSVMRDKYPEMRMNAVDAIFYLGTGKSVEFLIQNVGNRNPSVSNLIRQRLEDLTGVSFDDDSPKQWLKRLEIDFEDEICYRFGRPIEVKSIAEKLIEETNQTKLLEELRIITGVDFSSEEFNSQERTTEQTAKVKKWLARNEADEFIPGRVYKYGREQKIKRVFE